MLWQAGIVGDRSTRRFATDRAYRGLLREALQDAGYPPSHEVIAYEAATLPIGEPRVECSLLSALGDIDLRLQTTLVLPPGRAMKANRRMLERLEALDREADAHEHGGERDARPDWPRAGSRAVVSS